jgi:hypothetical protein
MVTQFIIWIGMIVQFIKKKEKRKPLQNQSLSSTCYSFLDLSESWLIPIWIRQWKVILFLELPEMMLTSHLITPLIIK